MGDGNGRLLVIITSESFDQDYLESGVARYKEQSAGFRLEAGSSTRFREVALHDSAVSTSRVETQR